MGCKDIGITKLEFVAKTEFLYIKNPMRRMITTVLIMCYDYDLYQLLKNKLPVFY